MRTFFTVWAGQLVSVVGTSLTGFGLQVWVFLETGSVTLLALVTLFLTLPAIVLAPIAGALVDRWDRRLAMLGADAAAAVATLGIALLFLTDWLSLWHIYVLVALGAIGNTFQAPAWMAAVPLLVPRRHLGRANGLVQANDGASLVIAPALAGALLATVGLGWVLVVDFATFLVAVATLSAVRFPRPESFAEAATGTVRGDVAAAWRYLRERGGLLWLLFIYAGVNFVLAFVQVLFIPLIVSFANEGAAGGVLSAAGIGMLSGSLLVSAWGGPRRLVRGTMGGVLLAGLFVVLAGLRPSVVLVGAGAFLLMFTIPIVNTASQVIWQTKVAPAVQGRVFALRRMMAQAMAPLAILTAGPLADGVFEPLLEEGGGLAATVGRIIGTGAGRGIALMVVLSGAATALLAVIGYLNPRIRHLETELPDMVGDAAQEPARR